MSANENKINELTREQLRARGIVAMGHVQRDEDGFTVYSTAVPPEPFRVWDDQHGGRRCTCETSIGAFASGGDATCEHMVAVDLYGSMPDDQFQDGVIGPEPVWPRLRKVTSV